jgi:hypothetical protein
MKMVLWCNEKDRSTPRDLHENPEWRARHIGDFEVEVVPRKGEQIQLCDVDADDSMYDVRTVVHCLFDGSCYVEIEWVEPDEDKDG